MQLRTLVAFLVALAMFYNSYFGTQQTDARHTQKICDDVMAYCGELHETKNDFGTCIIHNKDKCLRYEKELQERNHRNEMLFKDFMHTTENIMGNVGDVWKELFHTTENAMNTAVGFWKDLVNTAAGVWKDFVHTAVGFWKDLVNTAAGVWKDFVHTAVGFWKDLVNTAAGVWKDFVHTAVGFWKDLVNTAARVWNEFLHTVQLYTIAAVLSVMGCLPLLYNIANTVLIPFLSSRYRSDCKTGERDCGPTEFASGPVTVMGTPHWNACAPTYTVAPPDQCFSDDRHHSAIVTYEDKCFEFDNAVTLLKSSRVTHREIDNVIDDLKLDLPKGNQHTTGLTKNERICQIAKTCPLIQQKLEELGVVF